MRYEELKIVKAQVIKSDKDLEALNIIIAISYETKIKTRRKGTLLY